jgi:hypothetical protein
MKQSLSFILLVLVTFASEVASFAQITQASRCFSIGTHEKYILNKAIIRMVDEKIESTETSESAKSVSAPSGNYYDDEVSTSKISRYPTDVFFVFNFSRKIFL